MKRVKIFYVIGQLVVGGAERQLVELVKYLDKSKYLPRVCSLSGQAQLREEIVRAGVEVVIIERRHGVEFARLLRLYKLLRSERPQIVHTSMHSANTYGRMTAKLAGIPIVIASERGLEFLERNRIRVQIDRLLGKFSQKIVVNSGESRRKIIPWQRLDADKVATIYNGIEISRFNSPGNPAARKRALGIEPDRPVVGIIARLSPEKNHKCFLRAARKVTSGFPEARFLIVGDGEIREELEKITRDLGLSERVIFTGYRPDTPELLAAFDVSVLSSLSEGMPNVVLESMAAGKPVVATRVGACPEIVEEGKTGFLVPSDDSEALAGKIMRLLSDRVLAEAMGKAGRRRVEEEFTVEKMVRNYERLYEDLLRDSGEK